MRAKKSVAFRRDKPDLPAELGPGDESGQSIGTGDFVDIEEKHLQGLELPNLSIGAFRIDGSVLERFQLSGAQFGSAIWKDVRLSDCDLANIRAHRISLLRVELVNCRLTGFCVTALDCQDVLIQNGDVCYAQFRGAKFRNCEFEGCNWQDADLQEADLTGSIFRSCNMARADLRRAKLRNTDFRGSEIDGMLVGWDDLQGAIVDPAQAMVLARLLGLQIT